MFRKKIKFIIDKDYYTKEEVEESYIKRFPANMPSYMKIIPPFVFHKGLGKFIKGNSTARTCSGMINLFKRSFIYYSPWDIQILFEEDKIVSANFGSHEDLNKNVLHVSHGNHQLLDYIPNCPYKKIIKIMPHIGIKTNVPYILSHPWWHYPNVEIVPGILHPNSPDMNFFIPIRKNQNELLIKQGTPMFTATFLTEKKVDFKFEYGIQPFKVFKTFSNLKQHVLDSF